MEYTDEQLKRAISGWIAANNATLAENAVMPHYSCRHRSRIQAIAEIQQKRESRKRILRNIAGTAAMLLLVLGTVVFTSSEAYSAVRNWLAEVRNKLFYQSIINTEDDHAVVICTLGNLPEGFERVGSYHSGYSGRSIYRNHETGEYLQFEYTKSTEKQVAEIEKKGESAGVFSESGDETRYYYIERDGECSLFWYDPDHDLIFNVESNLSIDALSGPCANVRFRLPVYGPAWLPEGYTEVPEMRSTVYPWVIMRFTNDRGEDLVFSCHDMAKSNGFITDLLVENVEYERLEIDGNDAIYSPGIGTVKENDLIIVDDKNNLVFCISATLDRETLIKIAGSIRCTETEW